MQRNELLATIEQLHDIEVDTLDRDQLATLVAATARVRSWLDALELRCARQGRALADTGRAEPAPALIARHTGRSARDAEQITRRDRVAEAMPTFEDGLGNGVVTAGHLDAIANATRHAPPEVRAAFALHEHELLTFATADEGAGEPAERLISSPRWRRLDVVLSVLLALAVVLVWLAFRG